MSPKDERGWLRDQLSAGQASLIRIQRRLVDTRTRFQRAELVETFEFGRALVLDGTLQSAEADEWIYHESLVHPALTACPAAGQVAVLGGGEGATLREVLRHRWVERAVMVDIDAEVIDFCRRHLQPFHAGAFADPRAEVVTADARAWLRHQPDARFAAVIFDLSEPAQAGPSQLLFTAEFFAEIHRVLVPGGSLGLHAGPVDLGGTGLGAFFPRLLATVESVFGRSQPATAHVFSFSDLWAFAAARKGAAPLPAADRIDALLAERGVAGLRHYDGQCHAHMTHLPKYIRAQLADPGPIYTEADPPLIEPIPAPDP